MLKILTLDRSKIRKIPTILHAEIAMLTLQQYSLKLCQIKHELYDKPRGGGKASVQGGGNNSRAP